MLPFTISQKLQSTKIPFFYILKLLTFLFYFKIYRMPAHQAKLKIYVIHKEISLSWEVFVYFSRKLCC